MKQTTMIAIVVICVICTATMMGGCIGTHDVSDTIPAQGSTPSSELQSRQEYINNVPSAYDRAKIDQSDIRGSDGFALIYTVYPRNSLGNIPGGWMVYSLGTYPNVVDYHEDHHKIVVIVEHYLTNEAALAVRTEEIERFFPAGVAYDYVTHLHYGDQSYKLVSGDFTKVDEYDTIRGHSTRIVIFKDKSIGRLQIDGYYGNVNECTEVADYYAPILSAILDDLDTQGTIYPDYNEFQDDYDEYLKQ